ncbi:MAG: hypothetical protein LBC84_08010 [Prevotellaceae bacterium]|jgi:hypothetical protein|nr:hypothetical protein [Prevotellaceae bacterium]
MKKIILSMAVAICSVAIGLGIYSYQNTYKVSDLLAQNIEALAAQVKMDDGNGAGVGDNKVCYYKGTTDFSDWFECTSDYPDVGSCGNTDRKLKFFSKDKHACSM